MEQFRRTPANFAETDDADRFSAEFTANQPLLRPLLTAARGDRLHVAQAVNRHAQRKFRNGLIGIAGCIADSRMHLLGSLQIHMIHACERHINELQMRALADDAALQRHVCQQENIRILRAFAKGCFILTAGIRAEGVPFLLQIARVFLEDFIADSK